MVVSNSDAVATANFNWCAYLLVAITLLIVAVFLYIRQQLLTSGTLKPRVEKNQLMRGQFMQAALATTHYAIFSKIGDAWGRGKLMPGRTAVFLHGLGANLDQLTWGADGGLAQKLVDADFSLLAIDLYGHGFTDAPDVELRPDEFQVHVEDVLAKLGVTEPFDLIGFSHGCFVASLYASRKPFMVKRLVLVSPFGCDMPLHSWSCVASMAALFVHLTFAGNMSQLRTVYRIIRHLEGHRWSDILQSLHISTIGVLIIAGEWDRDPAMRILQHARRIHEALPRSTLHVVPRGTHMTWATGTPEQQQSLRALIVEFLAHATSDANSTVSSMPRKSAVVHSFPS